MSRFTVDVDYTPRRTDGGPGGLDMSKTVVHRVTVDAKDDNEACLLAAQLVGSTKGDDQEKPKSDQKLGPGGWPPSPWQGKPDGMVTRTRLVDWPSEAALRFVAEADTDGVMVCLVPPDSVNEQLRYAAEMDGVDPVPDDQYHITLLYLGNEEDVDREVLLSVMAEFADHAGWRGLHGTPNGWGTFNSPDEHVLVALWDIPHIAEFRAEIYDAVHGSGLPVVSNHGFTPHETMAYVDSPITTLPTFPTDLIEPMAFTEVVVAYGGEWVRYPLSSGHGGEGQWHEAKATVPPIQFRFEDQASQYPPEGPEGVSYFKGVIDDKRHVDCLLHRESGQITGILNHFPQDMLPYEKKGNFNVLVHPEHQRKGIATKLVDEAVKRWPINFGQQEYTPDGDAWVHRYLGTEPSNTPIGPKKALINPDKLDKWRPTKGMFEPGQPTLDPRFFDVATEKLRPEVRATVLKALDDFWRPRYGDWMAWAKVYLTGSGASYWWDSDHDFDTLITLDLDVLREVRPQNAAVSETDIDAHFDHELKTDLDPSMAATVFGPGEKPVAVTYFVNPGKNITDIKPYACYDLISDTWVVHPPKLPPDWGPQNFDDDVWRQCEEIARATVGVLSIPEPEARHEACVNLFDWLHLGRQIAYGPHGKGWLDIGNVIWQYLSQRPDRLLARLYEVKHESDLAVTAGPMSGRIPQAIRKMISPGELHKPRPVVLDKPAEDDLSHLPGDVRKALVLAVQALEDGRANLEAKARELTGSFTLRLTQAWRAAVYLGAESFWHMYWIGDHNYDEAERRFGALGDSNPRKPPGARTINVAHPGPHQFSVIPGERCSVCEAVPATTPVVVGSWLVDACDNCARRLVDPLLHRGTLCPNPSCDLPVQTHTSDGEWYEHADGSISHDDGTSVSDWIRPTAAVQPEVTVTKGTPEDYRGKFRGDPYRLRVTDKNFKGDPKHPYFTEPGTVGWLDVFHEKDNGIGGQDLHVGFVTVHPKYQRKGIANKLMRKAYDSFPGTSVRWGDLIHDASEQMFHNYQDTDPDRTGGAHFYGTLNEAVSA